MPSFEFYIDQKQTCWDRQLFKIKADSIKKAIIEAMKCYNNEIDIEPDYIYSMDNIEDILPNENDGQSTRELYTVGNSIPIAVNGSYPFIPTDEL